MGSPWSCQSWMGFGFSVFLSVTIGVWVLHGLVSHGWGLGLVSHRLTLPSSFTLLQQYYSVGIHVNQHFLLPVFKDINWSFLMKRFSSLVRSWDTGLFHLYVCICILGTFYRERLISS